MKGLKRLNLSFTYVTDRGIERLQQLPQLEELNLDTAEFITDAAVNYLRANRRLRKLVLRGTDVTASACHTSRNDRFAIARSQPHDAGRHRHREPARAGGLGGAEARRKPDQRNQFQFPQAASQAQETQL